jgi:hypothetical protein
MENLKFLLLLYVRPGSAMSEIIDRGSWLAGVLAVLIVSAAFFATVNQRLDEAYRIPNFYEFFDHNYDEAIDPAVVQAQYDRSKANYDKAMSERQKVPVIGDRFFGFFSFNPVAFYQPVLAISIFYVPFLILLMSIFGGLGSFGILLRRDYLTLATCTLMGWAAAHLPFAVAGVALYSQAVNPSVYFLLWIASGILFGLFMVFALRTVFGANFVPAILAVSIGWIAFSTAMYAFQFISPWLFSPFLIILAAFYFGGYIGGEVRGFGNAFRRRQDFNRFLHNATVNPKDADAHVQLGLIYLQRRQNTKALEHFEKAAEIDPTEIDANFQLGKIAREKGDLQTALNHFSTVVEQDDKYSLNEIWREIGATYMAANMHAEAADALEKYVDRRPVDPEGLYYLGKVLKAQGKNDRAREMFEQAVESVKIAPHYRRREIQKWGKLAEKEI